ncbi:MAG: DNA topoisomerase IV subunit A [Rhodobacteraceae bacterium]|nr:DNA topoisomerase IV subunit A [Paracoccaceae bacterium]
MTSADDGPAGALFSDRSAPKNSEPLREAIGTRYLTYALSTIMHRALPDARDGLKPVHRRILYAMRALRLSSSSPFRKSAKICGDVMGNYHPHGDAAIYDAMVRLAQDFNLRYPLVEGQGNFGNIDGDNPAASRYTEARLTTMAEALLEELGENAVDFRDNYDGSLREPVVLPAAFPNLLANGASGIAVGMATSIPPHNIAELCAACLHMIRSPDVRDDTLLNHVKGPDFPTGGVLIDPPATIAQAYRQGRGAFRLRCRWHSEPLGRGQWQIVVTEIPWQVQKSRLVEKIAEVIQLRKVPLLADVRDESAEDIRLILEPRARTVDPDILMNMMFRQSDLEVRIALNMNVLIDGLAPRVCSLKSALRAFLDHRRDVLLQRSRHRLGDIDHRLEVLEGLMIAFLHLDRVIDIIRYDASPRAALLAETWGQHFVRATSERDYVSPLPAAQEGDLSAVQVDAILNMRLRNLRRLEEKAIAQERDALREERAGLADLLASEDVQWAHIAKQIKQTRARFGKGHKGGRRRTDFAEAPVFEPPPPEAMIEREPITVVCSRMGWIRVLAGHVDLARELKFRHGDGPRFMFHAQTTDRLLIFSEAGRFYTINATNLPGGRGMGEPLRLMVDLPDDTEIVTIMTYTPESLLLVASSAGYGFAVPADKVVAQTRAGKQVLNLADDARAVVCRPIKGDTLACVGNNRKLLIFALEDLPQRVRGKGVRLQHYREARLSDATTFVLADGLQWKDRAGRTRTWKDTALWRGKRATRGRMAPRGFPQSNTFS